MKISWLPPTWPAQIFINDEKWQINTNIDTATGPSPSHLCWPTRGVVWMGWIYRGQGYTKSTLRSTPEIPVGLRFLACSSRSFGFPALFWIIRIRTWNINERFGFGFGFFHVSFFTISHCVRAITLNMQQMMQERIHKVSKSYWPDGSRIITRAQRKVKCRGFKQQS